MRARLCAFNRWKRPLGPCGFSAWSVTLPISGKSRLATTRIDEALLVQEICSPKNALLLFTSVQPSTSSSIVSLKKRRQKSTAAAVSAESISTVLPSLSTSRPPYDHSSGYIQPWLSPKPWPSSKPNGWPFFLSSRPADSRSSQVSGNLVSPTSLNQSVRYTSSWPILPQGTAFHF